MSVREKETQRGREKEEGGKAHQKTKHERELLKNQMKMKLYFCAWKKIKSNVCFSSSACAGSKLYTDAIQLRIGVPEPQWKPQKWDTAAGA